MNTFVREKLKINTWLGVALDISKLSTCHFTQCGCVILDENWKLMSTGYNGTIEGHEHCCDLEWNDSPEDREKHGKYADMFEIHAEANAIRHMPIKGKSLKCFTNISPCLQCMKLLASNGVTDIYFPKYYWRSSPQEVYNQAKNLGINIHYEQNV